MGDNMEIFGGFMAVVSILGLFLALIWLIMPFAVLSVKGKQDRILEILGGMEKRLSAIESRLPAPAHGPSAASAPDTAEQEQAAGLFSSPGCPGPSDAMFHHGEE
jgi:hypothetical protein